MRSKLFISIALLVVALHTIDGAPVPQVILTDVPGEALIGEDFTFKVTFQNVTGSTVGFGPFIDLVLDAGGANLKKSCNKCDGISFVNAKVIGISGGPVSFATFPVSAGCNATPATVPLTHPFASSGILPVTVPAGSQLVTIQLPFGSYDATQPPIVVEVTAHVSNFADDNVPVNISARGGFRFGTDALDNPSPDPPVLSDTNSTSSTWSEQKQTTPRVMVIKKECVAPEDETATGPNYPHTCTIKVDIANGQSIANLKVQDILANNVQYVGNVAVTIHTPVATQGVACNFGVGYVLTPPSSGPGGTLTVSFCKPIVGMPLPPDDVTIKFTFYIPEKDANGNPVLSPNCAPATSINKIHAEGDWTQTPPDPCDASPPPPLHVINNVTSAHTLYDKCLAIQKTVTDITPSGLKPKPGDTLRYVYNFQVSDYLTMGRLKVTDFLADGQDFIGNIQIKVQDQFATRTAVFPAAAFAAVDDLMGASKYCLPTQPPLPAPLQFPQGGKVLTFNISQAIGTLAPTVPRWVAGILSGGYAAGTPPGLPAKGRVRFDARIRDDFRFAVPTVADKYVDKDDPINNCVVIDGRVYQNMVRPTPINKPTNIPSVLIGSATDDSATHINIISDTPKKTVYAVKRGNFVVCRPSGPVCSNFPNAPQEVRPGDQVTFRIQKTIPTSDAEQLTIQDWLPLPIFDVTGMTFANSISGVPSSGNACLGPTDTLHLLVSPKPVFKPDPMTNSITFEYKPYFNDPKNNPRKIDLLFTSTVTLQPFADGLYLTNEMQECEKNTFGEQFCKTAVAQVKLREPKLTIIKGVIATNNLNGVLKPAPTPAVRLKPFGTSCPRYNPTINHANLGALFNSNLSNVDANDWVTFAIAIENVGGVRAYDIQLDDIIPCGPLDLPSCFGPDYSTLCVRRGSGTAVPFTTHLGGHCRTIIDLIGTPLDPLIPNITASTGTNIIIITFNAQLLPDIQPGCCDNRTDLLHYSSTPGGPDFVGAGFSPPFSDTATVCVNPTLTKSVVATSEVHTTPQTSSGGGIPNVAIGEIVRYRLTTLLPEGGALSNFQVTDTLPAGMKFLNDGTARLAFISDGAGISHPSFPAAFDVSGNQPVTPTTSIPGGQISGGANCGDPVIFPLGTIQNNDNDTNLEYVVIEFNALVCNVTGNTNNVTLPNKFSVSVDSNQIATSNAVNVVVVEPKLIISKTASPATVAQGGTVTYTVTITNIGTVNAFDVQFADTLAAGLTFFTGSTTVTGGCSSTSSTTPAVSCGNVSVNGVVTVTYTAVANPPGCPATLTNQANVTWTSLPGPKGTVSNPTGSTIPGASGANDGERDGVTPPITLNTYFAATSASVTVTCPPHCASPPSHMVSWWPLNETSGNTVQDIGPAQNNGTTSATIGSGPIVAWAPKVGSALFFGDSNASVPGNPYNFGPGSFSIDGWVRGAAHGPGVYLGIVDKLDSAASSGFAFFVGDNNNRLQFTMGNGPSSLATFMSNATNVFTYNQWQHVAVTVQRAGTSLVGTFYINGAKAGAFTPPATSVNNSMPLLIGTYRLNAVSAGCQSCEVALDEIEIFDNEVSPTDIKAIFDAGSIGKCRQP